MSASQPGNPGSFPVTRWTLVCRVQQGSGADAAKAMEELCAQYWYPIYAFTRRSGLGVHDAEDLTQCFFLRLIAGETIQAARQEEGRLRSFMLGLLKRVLADHLRRVHAGKRGGSPAATVSLDDDTAEERYASEPADVLDPETIFDRAWAEGVLAAAERKLRDDFVRADNLDGYAQLREFLPLGDNATPYAAVAKQLAVAEGTLRLQIHRMRKRYGALIEEEIAQTVEGPGEVKAELDHLMAVIGR
jgi:RNA polymerase sigma-70 factor (ECF subfamily)